MITQVFSVYDSKAESYIQPFFAPTVAVGLRLFDQAVQDERNDFHRFAGDYTLFHLGAFDSATGVFTNLEHTANLGLALALLKQTPDLAPPLITGVNQPKP